jgi:hypothetical protein
MPSMSPSYRVPRRHDRHDGNTRRLALIACGIGGALLLLFGAWSLAGSHRGGVPVIQAASGPVRTKPENPGGMQVAGQNESILDGDAQPDSKAALAPPPEAPAPQALKAEAQAPASPVAAPPVAHVATPAPPVGAPMLAAAPVKAEPKRVAKAALHGPQVQLAALTTEQAARVEWERLTKKMPAVFDGRRPAVMKIEHDGKTFWRLRTGGFADAAQAESFCAEVKAKGAGCEVARS